MSSGVAGVRSWSGLVIHYEVRFVILTEADEVNEAFDEAFLVSGILRSLFFLVICELEPARDMRKRNFALGIGQPGPGSVGGIGKVVCEQGCQRGEFRGGVAGAYLGDEFGVTHFSC